MENFKIKMFGVLALIMLTVSCKEEKQVKVPEVNVTTIVKKSDGLDLKLVGALLQNGKITNAESLEKELNKTGGINNLDLNGDKKVDFINVSENNSTESVKSFDLTTGSKDELTHIATIEVEKGKEAYNINLSGSETIYGRNQNYNYSSGLSVSDVLLMQWMFSSRPSYYHTPYDYYNHPKYYHSPTVVNRTTYINRTVNQRDKVSRTINKVNTPYKSKITSPNIGKVSKSTRTSIKNNNKNFKSLNVNGTPKTKITSTGFNKTTKSNDDKKTVTPVTKKTNSFWGSTTKKTTKTSSWGSSTSRSYRSPSRSFSRKSDGNYKIEIVSVYETIDKLKQLNPVTYKWDTNKLDSDEKFRDVVGTSTDLNEQVGFIAQELEQVFPLLVREDENGNGLSVDYDLMVAYLVQGIKEQQTQIEDLKSEVNKIKTNLK